MSCMRGASFLLCQGQEFNSPLEVVPALRELSRTTGPLRSRAAPGSEILYTGDRPLRRIEIRLISCSLLCTPARIDDTCSGVIRDAPSKTDV